MQRAAMLVASGVSYVLLMMPGPRFAAANDSAAAISSAAPQ
jgi:hypothetical protein